MKKSRYFSILLQSSKKEEETKEVWQMRGQLKIHLQYYLPILSCKILNFLTLLDLAVRKGRKQPSTGNSRTNLKYHPPSVTACVKIKL